MEWTLANIVRTHAVQRGGQPMLTYGARTITYAAMHDASNRVAQALLAEGIGRQDRVAFLDKNGPEYFDFAEALPRNPSGKLLERQLREPYWKGHARRIN
jgi:acyl-CoA synthetase (AMP-forming)/AMP-acid ligase II